MKHFFLSLALLLASATLGAAQVPGTTSYPTSLDSNTSLITAANNCSTTLNGAINAAVTSITVTSQTCFPSTGVFVIDAEYFIYTASTATTFTVTRGAFGSTAASHATAAAVRFTVSAAFHNVLKDAIIAAQTKIGTGSSTPTANTVLRGTGTGTSAWGQIVNADISNSAAISISKLSITGTPDGTKFLRDDGSWQAASGGGGSGTVDSATADQVAVYTGTTTVDGATDFTFTRSTSAKTMTITSASSTALIRVTPTSSGNSGFSATTSAHPGTGGGVFLPFVAGSQSDGPGIWWTNGGYGGLAGIWLSGGFNLQGWNSSNSALKLRKGTGTSSDGAATFTFDPDSGYAQLSPFGTSSGETTTIRFLELAANGTNYFATKAADNIATTRTLVWPNDDPSAGEVLSVTGYSSNVITTEWLAATTSAANTPSQITGDQNNYAPGGSTFQRWSSDASRNITGLTAGVNGEYREIWNVGSNNIVLQHENASSTAANRFLTSTGADLTLSANKCAIARYDATSSRWRVYLAN